MNERVKEAARDYAEHAPVPRIALFDIALPSSDEEFKRTGGNGVLLLTALSQDDGELPPKRLYISSQGTEHNLEVLHCASDVSSKNEEVARVLGAYRADCLYLFPATLMHDGAVLTIDFARNRDGFVFGEFSTADRESIDYDLTSTPDPFSRATLDAVGRLVAREYPGFMKRAP